MRFRIEYLILIVQASIFVLIGLWMRGEGRAIERIQNEVEAPASTPTPPEREPDTSTHSAAIKQIEDDAGMLLSRVAIIIIKEEGKRDRPYLDTHRNVTIGVGRNLTGNGVSVDELHAIVPNVDYRYMLSHASVTNGRVRVRSLEAAERIFPKALTHYDIQLLLTDDLNTVRRQAEEVFGDGWGKIDVVRKEVIVSLIYNLGAAAFQGV